jgi:selenocysteine-specific elongation factor
MSGPNISRRIIIGTAGHIDHGKSALVRALTGTDPDRLKEEKARGITIELGFAHLQLPSGTLAGLVDVPGHERFVRTMVAGAAGIDIVLLVIGVDEGVKPQTREHLDICRLLDIRHGIVVLNKRDRVDDEWAQLQEEDVRDFIRGTFLESAPVLHVSALTGQGIPELVSALDALAIAIPGKDSQLPFRLPVDRSFTIKGFGTVVTGTVAGGSVRSGDEIVIQPNGILNRVRGLQVHGNPSDRAVAGNRVAVNLQGIEKEVAPRGSVLCVPGDFHPTRSIEGEIEYLRLAPRPLKTRDRVTFHSGTASTRARVVLYGRNALPPGESAMARIDLEDPFVLMGGDRFILRGFTPLANFGYTVGGGIVLHPYPPVRRKAGKLAPPVLEALRRSELPERVLAALEDAGFSGITGADIPIVVGAPALEVRKSLDRLVGSEAIYRAKTLNGYRFWHGKAITDAAGALGGALGSLHERFPDREGFQLGAIVAAVGKPIDDELAEKAVTAISRVEKGGDLYFLPDKRPAAIELSTPFAISVSNIIRGAGLAGLSLQELADALPPQVDPRLLGKTVEALIRGGRVQRIKELHFDPESVALLEGKLREYLERHGEITVPEFKDLAGLSRKYVIPLIEHFDMTRVTLRVGEKRILRKSANG